MLKNGNKKAKAALELADNPDNFFSPIRNAHSFLKRL